MFAAGITGLAILGIVLKDFIVGRPPAWSSTLHLNPAVAYVPAALLILSAIFVVFPFKGRTAALLIALLILLLSLSRHLPNYLNDWVNVYKTLALLGGALIAAASFGGRSSRALLLAGSLLVASFFIAGGYAHFKWADGVQYLSSRNISRFDCFGHTSAACAYSQVALALSFRPPGNGLHCCRAS